ncbi:hypothetical protein JOB18_014087 [Solea senegalensis]|uniref:Uncharacterized protein n=1 Tax=Solea senegalensis TaxID=28829 RepID=A0AAV6SWJ8_SOLSE|nr:hypothetical protein JOB18_014087 [Solea senegalensis]
MSTGGGEVRYGDNKDGMGKETEELKVKQRQENRTRGQPVKEGRSQGGMEENRDACVERKTGVRVSVDKGGQSVHEDNLALYK